MAGIVNPLVKALMVALKPFGVNISEFCKLAGFSRQQISSAINRGVPLSEVNIDLMMDTVDILEFSQGQRIQDTYNESMEQLKEEVKEVEKALMALIQALPTRRPR